MFKDGQRQRDWSPKDLLPMSAKLIPEFDRRRSIKDMFARKPSIKSESSISSSKAAIESQQLVTEGSRGSQAEVLPASQTIDTTAATVVGIRPELQEAAGGTPSSSRPIPSGKRRIEASNAQSVKRSKPSTITRSTNNKGQPGKGQSSLMGFSDPRHPERGSGHDSAGSHRWHRIKQHQRQHT